MRTIEEILNFDRPAADIVADLTNKTIRLRPWSDLRREYDPEMHPVVADKSYTDVVEDGKVDRVTRITYDLQRLATKRMTELTVGIPVKRVYKAENDRQQEAADLIESIYKRVHIDSVNVDRCNKLFAGCEIVTLWYGVRQPNKYYGLQSDVKIRCATYSPMNGDRLYPLFDESGDLIALSIAYTRKVADAEITYFDAYTADQHIKFDNQGGWRLIGREEIKIGKIPAIYCYRPTPIWEQTSRLVYEMEWAMSRNGNYLRKNSRPLLAVYADEQIPMGDSPAQDKSFKDIFQFPSGSRVEYVTWPQATPSLEFYLKELRQQFFTQLQLPDWSYESMKSTPMSGESRKQLFIDCQMKVRDEAGRLLEAFDRETSVVKEFAKTIRPDLTDAIADVGVENVITPFMLEDSADKVNEYATATASNIMSRKSAIQKLGYTQNADEELAQMRAEAAADALETAM